MNRFFRRVLLTIFSFCFIIASTTLTMLYGCSKIEDFEDLDIIPNPYKNRTSSDFIAVFGDIQYYTNYRYIDLFKHSLDWIAYNANKINLLCTLHTGDITSNNSVTSEWKYFEKALKNFSKAIPFISNIGDHDYTWDGDSKIISRSSTHINEYIKLDNIETAFEAGHMENIVVRNEIHGERYDILLLEFYPRKEVVYWANEWVASHPDVKYILMTHRYLANGGGRASKEMPNMRITDNNYTSPDELWNQLIKCHDNIAWVLCGHVGGLYAVTYEKNDFGREVCQIQHNIQGAEYRYDNWLMMWEFPEDDDEAVVTIVNTRTGLLFESKESLFSFKYRY